MSNGWLIQARPHNLPHEALKGVHCSVIGRCRREKAEVAGLVVQTAWDVAAGTELEIDEKL